MENTNKTEQKVFAFIEKYRLLDPGEKVIVGVSGGADSVCLLFVLLKWAAQKGLSLHVVHVSHGIRPEALQDADFVRGLCERFHIPFTLAERDVRAAAAKEKRSEEEMGRILRYEAFQDAVRRFGAQKIAVAHTCNDQAETMLFHLFRGSGLWGLGGIRPMRDNIIRPLLVLERGEIEAYLREKGIDYCQDATNDTDDYVRNRIRHHILPYAEEQIAQGSIGHMCQTAQMIWETEEYLLQQTEAAALQVVKTQSAYLPAAGEDTAFSPKGQETFCLDAEVFRSLPPVIGKRLILLLLKSLSPSGKDIAYVHVRDVYDLFVREGNGSVDLPCGICARRLYGEGFLEKRKAPAASFSAALDVGKIPAGGLEIRLPGHKSLWFTVFPFEKNKNIPKNEYTKWFDCDKINKSLAVRTRRTGDFLTVRSGAGGRAHQLLKQYMINEKIPRTERDGILLLAEEGHVLWVVGRRISEYYKVDKDTKHILQVRLADTEE